jgi:HEAT repeat protein
MLRIVHRSEGDGSAWLRSTALRILGDSRDPSLADVYLAHLGDASDRVINAAAIALGRTGDARAWPALSALRHHPSWKHQSLISALAGLRELGDPRGADVALAALEDVHSTRWVLATAVWDYPVAAAQTLAALGQGARGVPVLRTRLDAALQGRDTTDVFYTLLLLATLGDEGGRPAFALVRARHGADAGAQEALAAQEAMLEQAIAVAAAARQGGATPRTPR